MQIYTKFAINLRYVLKSFPLKILLQVNLRLRACLAMCLKYKRFQRKCAYKARAYKNKSVNVNPQTELNFYMFPTPTPPLTIS